MATPPRETSEERLAAAQARAAAAADVAAAREDGERAKASRTKLARLLKLDAATRFEALSDGTDDLVPADRRRLVRSLKGQAPPRVALPGGTASRWAIFRSRLPYRRRALVLTGLGAAWMVTAGLVAWSNTPLGQVQSVFPQDVAAVFSLPNGVVVYDRLTPGETYGLVRSGNEEAVLRKWVPGIGYAQAYVTGDWVRWH